MKLQFQPLAMLNVTKMMPPTMANAEIDKVIC